MSSPAVRGTQTFPWFPIDQQRHLGTAHSIGSVSFDSPSFHLPLLMRSREITFLFFNLFIFFFFFVLPPFSARAVVVGGGDEPFVCLFFIFFIFFSLRVLPSWISSAEVVNDCTSPAGLLTWSAEEVQPESPNTFPRWPSPYRAPFSIVFFFCFL